MAQFLGFVALDSAIEAVFVTRNGSDVPTNADATPTYRVYGSVGIMANGTGNSAKKDASEGITAASNASPIVITDTAHGLSTGTRVTVASVGGNTAANGTHIVTYVTDDTFSLDGSTGNGAYTSGGEWNVAGLYRVSFTPTAANGFAVGVTYTIIVQYEVSSTSYVQTFCFTVT